MNEFVKYTYLNLMHCCPQKECRYGVKHLTNPNHIILGHFYIWPNSNYNKFSYREFKLFIKGLMYE